ncbi:hypothetical protein ACNF42_07800, partial [Cuniculiplasma sp. SKW3]|uniref:hypothetical protein n=1 Tax=Cuniculiplasma sp. SKW3 TaxID=3400170 RepID=UPI003FD1D5FD
MLKPRVVKDKGISQQALYKIKKKIKKVLPTFMWVILSNALIYYLMDECQLYSTLLELKSPWKVENVSLNSVK